MIDAAIIGAGSMGMAAGYYLSKAGKSVVLLDKYDPPHSEGSHHGESRIIRHAYGEGEKYVPLALRSQQLWENLEKEAAAKVFLKTGVLNIGTKNSAFLSNVIKSAKEFSLPAEILQAEEINKRWPGYHLSDELMGCYEQDSGVLFSEEAISSYRRLAVQNGAQIYPYSTVQSIKVSDEKASVHLGEQIIEARHLIITAGKGTSHIASLLDINLPLYPVRKTFSWFHSDEKIYNPLAFPAWSFDDAESTYYGFPDLNGDGMKIGRHDGGVPVDPDDHLKAFGTYQEDGEDTANLAAKLLSEEIKHKEGKVCTYTNTPDGDFIIDHLPNYSNIIIACGFSGHGFKFSSGIGEVLSEMVLNGSPSIDISSFRMKRFRTE